MLWKLDGADKLLIRACRIKIQLDKDKRKKSVLSFMLLLSWILRPWPRSWICKQPTDLMYFCSKCTRESDNQELLMDKQVKVVPLASSSRQIPKFLVYKYKQRKTHVWVDRYARILCAFMFALFTLFAIINIDTVKKRYKY